MSIVTRAIFPGSFDPVHFGHLDVLRQASKTFNSVVWALVTNPEKKSFFSKETRQQMMKDTLKFAELDNVSVNSFADTALLVSIATSCGATHIVRALRSGMDFDYEYQMTMVNRHLRPKLMTVYFAAEQEHLHISSTVVRQLIQFRSDIGPYVPQAVLEVIGA